MVDATTRRDPATVIAWAASVGGNSQRFDLLADVVRHWSDDPDQARAAVR